jgi:predicted 2-oxoglutarate/Fe(II)-dependent dioxygenase YbiX
MIYYKKGEKMNWTKLPRLEKTNKRLEDEILIDEIIAKNLDYGIYLYENAIKKEDCDKIINDLENEISKGINGIKWSGAQVNDKEDVNDVRNCLDLKFKREHLGKFLPESKALFDSHLTVDKALDKCLKHYESLWHLKMHYKEAFNFVKYLPGKYFKIHADHGPYYACTVSAVVYLNDDFEGGEIEFVRQGLVIKPKAGDIVMFPSNFVYEHASLEVRSGVKYSVVIMTDYNDMHHGNK